MQTTDSNNGNTHKAARRAIAVARHMGLVEDRRIEIATTSSGKEGEEKLRLKKEQRKKRREEERRLLGEERVEDFNVDVLTPL
jgi:hypothetical protein